MTALVIVSVACSAMLLAVGQSMQTSAAAIDTCRATLLAQALMDEISSCRWTDLDDPAHWGPEAGETASSSRAGFDDLDDYDGWTGAPETRSGRSYAALQGALFPAVPSSDYAQYTCSVQVAYVSAAGEPLAAGLTSPYRRVTLDVSRMGEPPHSLAHVFEDHASLLDDEHWWDPLTVEPAAVVEIVP